MRTGLHPRRHAAGCADRACWSAGQPAPVRRSSGPCSSACAHGATRPPRADGRRAHCAGCGTAGALAPETAATSCSAAHARQLPWPCSDSHARRLGCSAPAAIRRGAAGHGPAHPVRPAPLPRAGLARRFGGRPARRTSTCTRPAARPRSWSPPAVFDSRLELFASAEPAKAGAGRCRRAAGTAGGLGAGRQAEGGRFHLCMRTNASARPRNPGHRVARRLAAPHPTPPTAVAAARAAGPLRAGRATAGAATALPPSRRRPRPSGNSSRPAPARTKAAAPARAVRPRLGDAQGAPGARWPTHRPGAASRAVPAQGPEHGQRRLPRHGRLGASPLPHHPGWLLPEPLPLADTARCRCSRAGPLQLVSGPSAIEAGWWDGPARGAGLFHRPGRGRLAGVDLARPPAGRGGRGGMVPAGSLCVRGRLEFRAGAGLAHGASSMTKRRPGAWP